VDSSIGEAALNTTDALNNVVFTDGLTVTAKVYLTLKSKTGMLVPSGDLTLRAGVGISLLDNLKGAAAGKVLNINSDFEIPGDGKFAVKAGSVIDSNNSDILITAWDMDIGANATIGSGNAAISVHGSQLSQTRGVGATSRDMGISNAEL
jgi:hypothetical protein